MLALRLSPINLALLHGFGLTEYDNEVRTIDLVLIIVLISLILLFGYIARVFDHLDIMNRMRLGNISSILWIFRSSVTLAGLAFFLISFLRLNLETANKAWIGFSFLPD
jgi:hypothetical protein